MEEVAISISNLEILFTRITKFLLGIADKGPAVKSLYEDSKGVLQFLDRILSAKDFSHTNLSTAIGGVKSFSRHLSEIEESVYYEIGEEDLENIKAFINQDTEDYNIIHSYLNR